MSGTGMHDEGMFILQKVCRKKRAFIYFIHVKPAMYGIHNREADA